MDINQFWKLNRYLKNSLNNAKKSEELNAMHCIVNDEIINHDHKDIRSTSLELVKSTNNPWETVRTLFDFVRDRIIYDFAPEIVGPSSWHASVILKEGRGFCHQKAILFTALLRAAGVPTALVFQNVKDHILLSTRYKSLIPGGILPMHALVAVNVNDKWYRLDATLDSGLCLKKGYCIPKVVERKESLLPENTLNGTPHFTIKKELGYFEFYPEEFRLLLLENIDSWNSWRRFVKKKQLTM